jgi:hypothetical protein
MILALLACESPGTLSSVADALATDAEVQGEPALRLTTAVAGVLAETCGVDDISSYAFSGGFAAAMGVTGVTVTTSEEQFIWTATDVGLDGNLGTLAYTTNSSAQNFAIEYANGTEQLTAGFETKNCDDEGVIVSGTGTWSSADLEVALTILGVAPSNGLVFRPTTASYPSGGWIKATEETAGWEILLDDAAGLGF